MPSSRPKILIVEDDETLALLVHETLAAKGFDTKTLENGAKVVDTAKDWKPDLILLDVMLPGLDGCSACRLLKADKAVSHIPVIIVTALNRIEDQEKAMSYQADDFLGKPFETDRLLQKIAKHLPQG
jgi:two-component system cell cycle response regulator